MAAAAAARQAGHRRWRPHARVLGSQITHGEIELELFVSGLRQQVRGLGLGGRCLRLFQCSYELSCKTLDWHAASAASVRQGGGTQVRGQERAAFQLATILIELDDIAEERSEVQLVQGSCMAT